MWNVYFLYFIHESPDASRSFKKPGMKASNFNTADGI